MSTHAGADDEAYHFIAFHFSRIAVKYIESLRFLLLDIFELSALIMNFI